MGTQRHTSAEPLSEETLRVVSARRFPSGIYAGIGGEFAVTAPGGMLLNVAAGELEGNGYWYQLPATYQLTVSANNSGLPRIDRVVIPLLAGAVTVNPELLVGVPAATPAAPALRQTGNRFDMALVQVPVAAGATNLALATLVDERVYALPAGVQPMAHVWHNANQSIGSSVTTGLSFNSERFDTNQCHDVVTNNSRLICRTPGKYRISASVLWASNNTGYRELKLLVNSVTQIAYSLIPTSSVTSVTQNVSVSWHLNAGDYVEMFVTQTSGGSLSILTSDPNSPQFMWERIGP